MSTIDKQEVLSRLRQVGHPAGGDLVSSGAVGEVAIAGNNVMFALTVPPDKADVFEPVRKAAEAVVSAMPGIGKVMVALTAERAAGAAAQAPPSNAPSRQAPPAAGNAGVPGVRNIIAVASGKGGVGKSTTAVNLALGLKAQGISVGILDADIYGPSLPRLLGLNQRPEPVSPGSRVLHPLEAFGLKAMSIGFMVEEDTPVIWRGPMVMSALRQMLHEVAWEALDVLVVDMPPGTGDAQLTMAQQTPLAGAVIVSTPQDLALIDARKGLNMFKRVDVPVLGIVENMSYFLCSQCGTRHEIFGHGGARAEAAKLGVPFLGEVPLDAELRERSDSGRPVVATAPQSHHAEVYRRIGESVWLGLSGEGEGAGRAQPRIVVE